MLKCYYPTDNYSADPVWSEEIPSLEIAQESYLLNDFWHDFQRVIRRELETFEIFMDLLFTEENWRDSIPPGTKENKIPKESMLDRNWRKLSEYEEDDPIHLLHDTRSLEERIACNPVCAKYLPLINDLEPLRKHLSKSWTAYTDIYGQDIYTYEHDGRKPLVLTLDGKYLGHIYRMGGEIRSDLNFIGIRESWSNTLEKLYFGKGFRGVGYHILKCTRMVCKRYYPQCTSIVLNQPIGPMAKIASNYGFKYTEEMQISDKPKVKTQKILI